jgi:hypothetical protein
MKGILNRKTKRICKTYTNEDYDERTGDFIFLIEPFEIDEEPFYYLEKTEKGYNIEGELYIFEGQDRNKRARDYAQETRQRIGDKKIKFVKVDKEGNLI